MKVDVSYSGKKTFNIKTESHELIADVPEEKGGENKGPTPVELFVASIGSCMGIFGTRYLKTAGLDPEGFSIKMDWDYSEDKKRVGRIDISVSVPNAELGPRKKALITAMENCIIHNTLHENPEMNIEIQGEE